MIQSEVVTLDTITISSRTDNKYIKEIDLRTFVTIKNTVLSFEKDKSHSYRKIGNNQGKLLVTYTPGGFENFFKELGLSKMMILESLEFAQL